MTNTKDEESLIGKKFGILTVIEINYNMSLDFTKHHYLLCECDCGNFTSVTYKNLINNRAKSCGCRNINNILGMKFNMLTAIKRVWNEKFKRSEWLCVCECGNNIITSYSKLNSGHTKSCGCLRLENFKKIVENCTKHNMTKTRFHTIWIGIKARCLCKYATSYDRYGGKGIKICDRWLEFINFKEDMYESYLEHVAKYGEKETTIDRINSKKDYYKENCKWATNLEQAQNTSSSKLFKATSPDGTVYYEKVLAKFAREHNISEEGIRNCIYKRKESIKGWKFERIEENEEI